MRLYTFIAAIVFMLVLSSLASAQDLSKLVVLTEEYPPYNYMEDGKVHGLSTEIVLQLLDRLGTGLTREDIRIVPWVRAYNEVLVSKDAILFSMARTPERQGRFQLVGPIGFNSIGVIARKVDRVVIKSPEDFEKYRIGVVREDIGHQLLRKIIPEKDLDIASASEYNLRKLKGGRIDLFIYDVRVADYVIARQGLDPDEFETVYVLDDLPYYIAFNKHADDAMVQAFQEALDQLLKEQSLKECP